MALLWVEGFEQYCTNSSALNIPIAVNYDMAVTNLVHAASGRFSGQSITTNATSRAFTTPGFGNKTSFVVGMAIWRTSSAAWVPFTFMEDGGATSGLNVLVNSSGTISVRRGSTVLSTSAVVVPNDTWVYLEFRGTIDNATGSYSVHVNEVEVDSGTSVDTQAGTNGNADRIQFIIANNTRMDDVYILDTLGGSMDDFLGSRRVVTVFPDAAGDVTEFTPDTGTNYQRVDEKEHDGDTSYVEASTTDDTDLYGFADISELDSIDGVMFGVVARQTDVDPFDMVPVVKSGSTEYDQTTLAVDTSSYATYNTVVATDPDTASAWTVSGLNAAQFGMKVG